ncbi:hypothetical protein JCM17823_03370 [Halorubrum gandharaense]
MSQLDSSRYSTLDKRFHVVCRDCPTEKILHDAIEAASFVDEHVESEDHTVIYERIE